ncbi:MAG: hypothetical protein JNN22_14630 [Rhodospirillales bacterium]|nr:hypothetical protein [Rhodospirillales bacterium]
MKSRISDLFFQATARRHISLKAIARIGGCSAISVERLKSGETKKLDVELVYRVARTLPDADAFIQEVMPGLSGTRTSPELASIDSKLEEIRQFVASSGVTTRTEPFRPVWCLDDGTCVHVVDGFAQTARRVAGIPTGDRGDATDFVCRGFGWIAVGERDGFGQLIFDREHVDPRACTKALAVMELMPYERVRIDICGEEPVLEAIGDARRILERRIRASRPTPRDWVDLEVPVNQADERLRRVLATRFADDPLGHMVRMLREGESSLFSVRSGEAYCYHIGSKFNAPTQSETGMRVLDRTNHVQYSAMIDRHIVKASRAAKPTVSRIGVDFGFRRTLYERLALPFRLDGREFVLTTSKILQDSAPSALN